MQVPNGMTEAEVLATIDKIARRLSPKFKFGYHEVDDIKQQIFIFAWESLKHYDSDRPLENFLWVHVRNRLLNFKRDSYERPDKPCHNCKWNAYDVENDYCTKHELDFITSGCSPECKPYLNWKNRNEAKKNLMTPIELSNVRDEHEERMKVSHPVDEIVMSKEIHRIINNELPINMRSDYLRMISNVHVPKPRRTVIQETIKDILAEHGYDDIEETW